MTESQTSLRRLESIIQQERYRQPNEAKQETTTTKRGKAVQASTGKEGNKGTGQSRRSEAEKENNRFGKLGRVRRLMPALGDCEP